MLVPTIHLTLFFVCGLVGGYVSDEQRRSNGEGFCLGLALGPLGVRVVSLPTTIRPPARKLVTPDRLARRGEGGWLPMPRPRDDRDEELITQS